MVGYVGGLTGATALGWDRLTHLAVVMARTSGDLSVSIGVLDGPVAAGHRLLAAPVTELVPGACRPDPGPGCEHGTLVAGVLGASRDSGAAAIAPGCPLLIRPVFTGQGAAAPPDELADGIAGCVAAGARIINISAAFAGGTASRTGRLTAALDHAASRGVLVVAAAGNEASVGGSPLVSHPWVVPVTACDERGIPLAGSNMGRSIGRRGLRAPGTGIVGLSAGGGLGRLSGTSAAAVVVTGALALAWSAAPQAQAGLLRAAVNQQRPRTGMVPPLLDAGALWNYMEAR